MKRLTNLKKFTLALVFTAISVISWGQEPIDLYYDCTIEGVEDGYTYTGEVIPVTFTVNYDETIVASSHYTLSITYNGTDITDAASVNIVSDVVGFSITNKGNYIVTVTAKEGDESYEGEIRRNFFVMAGAGTAGNPYTIGTTAEWNTFANAVNNGYSFEGKTVKLTDDITVSTMVGNDSYGFSGTFDGSYSEGVHTLTFDHSVATLDGYIAPFYYVDGANIQNLIVGGSIVSDYSCAAGLIYSTTGDNGSTNVQNVTVSMNINAIGIESCAGFSIYSPYLSFTNCMFNGKIVAGANSGGFSASYYETEPATFTNCIFDPADGSKISSGKPFAKNIVSDATCYYTELAGTTAQGTKVYKERPSDIVKPATILSVEVYMPVDVEISGVDLTYAAGTNHYSTIMDCDITFDGVTKELSELSDNYNVDIKKNGSSVGTSVETSGDYAITITGKGDYSGTYEKWFYVIGDIALENPSLAYSSTNPYVITSASDWMKLAKNIKDGVNDNYYADKYYKLTNNITIPITDVSIPTMVGTSEHPFSGDFNGTSGETTHTLTFNYGTSSTPTDEEYCAPFHYTNGANIHDLNVAGTIYTNVGFEAGLIGVNTGATTVSNVIVSTNLVCNESLWYEEGGGFAVDGTGIAFRNCVYNGLMVTSNYSGGFCGMANNTTTFSYCLFNPAAGSSYWGEYFVYNNDGATISATCYYTSGGNQDESEQGTEVYVTIPADAIGKFIKDKDDNVITICGFNIYKPVAVVIEGLANKYVWTGENIDVTYTVEFDGYTASSGDYDGLIDPSPVQNVGTYILTITAKGDYSGTKTRQFKVVKGTSTDWTGLQAQLSVADAEITIDLTINKSYVAGEADAALIIGSGKTVTINMNGATLNRDLYDETTDTPELGGQVLRISSGAEVTIVGPGTITGGNNKAESSTEHGTYSDGGGIWNMGTLTLENVTVKYNKCEKKSQDVSRTGRGGGIYSGNGSTLKIFGGSITHNKAQGGGGGLYSEKAAVFSINDKDIALADTCYIHSNTSQDKGGGIRVDASSSTAVIKKCSIVSNNVELHNAQSASFGGGIHLDAGRLNLTNCALLRNSATKYGGGIYIMKGTLNAQNCQIMYNMSYDDKNLFSGNGGGVCIMGGTFNMDGGMVYENFSYKDKGGGIFVNSNGTLGLQGNVFVTGNKMFNDSGLQNGTVSNVYIQNKTGKVSINGTLFGSSRIGVAKNDISGNPVFTTGLYSHSGTISNFVSDESKYTIIRSSGEAKFSEPGPWNPSTDGYVINTTYIVNTGINAGVNTITFGDDGCLIIVDEGEGKHGCLTASITNLDPNKLVINGGELITTSAGVKATSIKSILGALSYQNWYLISTPFNSPTICMGAEGGTNLITQSGNGKDEYDLYRFNEATNNEDPTTHFLLHWENFRNTDEPHAGFNVDNSASALENGRGYLYRNENDYTVVTRGVLNVAEYITYYLTCTTTNAKNKFPGFNIIGNPYSHNIYKNDEYKTSGDLPAINDDKLTVGYYRLVQGSGTDSDRWEPVPGYGNPIKPMEGVLVQATESHTMTITNTTNEAASYSGSVVASKGRSGYESIKFEVSRSNVSDVAYAMFSGGRGLGKIEQLNEQTPILYISQNDKNYAIATMNDNIKAFNLNFEAKTMGQYTLSVKPEGEFSYIHLYDKLTREDVDMLVEKEYTFIGSQSDVANRFVVRLCEASVGGSNDLFAYQSGDDIIVEGEGELQVFDVMGRIVATQRVNGVQTVNGLDNGVYIFRLDGMTQKIVLR